MKKFNVRIENSAIQDIQDAITYYNEQQKGLGNKFHTFIKEALQVLTFSPFFKVYHKNVRCLPLIRFPFSIFFTVDEDNSTVHIVAILHQALDPDKINKRF
jgi:plasmid stabilization system protein ParE